MRVVGGESLRWQLSADAEALTWVPATPTAFLVSTEDGIVAAFDARKGSGEEFSPRSLKAGRKAVLQLAEECPVREGLGCGAISAQAAAGVEQGACEDGGTTAFS